VSTSNMTIQGKNAIYNHLQCPCRKCLIRPSCTQSMQEGTICDEYKQFIIKLVEAECENTNSNDTKKF
jgi:hypothetical protein